MTEYLVKENKKQTENIISPEASFMWGVAIGSLYNYQWYSIGMKCYKFFNNMSPSVMYIRESLAAKEAMIVGAVSAGMLATAANTEYLSVQSAAINFCLITAESTLYFMSEATGSSILEYSSVALLIGHAVYNADTIFDMLELV